ncbi:MAG: hypothetical protein KKA79_05220, partial [Nanoarchaeota archaeon]|nr:hypothetical protein [Nanoarchaeota archaeon]
MSIKKVKLFKTPSLEENWIPLGVNTPSLPPLSLGIITAHLRGKGFDVDQDDLNQKVNNSNFHFGNKMDLSLLKDYERVINFLKGHDDKEIQSLVDSMASLTSLDGFDVYLISIGFARSFTNILSAILLCKYIKEVYDKPVILGGEINNLLLKLNSEFFLFDYAILGSGEGAVHDLLLSLDSERSLDNIKGLVHWVKGKKVINEGSYLKLLIKPDFKGLPLDLYRWSPPKVLDKHIPDEKCNKILILPF